MSSISVDGHEYLIERDMVEVTSNHRPDTRWRFVDAAGHEHRWHVGGAQAAAYDPAARHETPTLAWVKDGEEYWPGDDEPHDVGHHECRLCGERVEPGYCMDEYRVYVPGIARYWIDGRSVSPEAFEAATGHLRDRQWP